MKTYSMLIYFTGKAEAIGHATGVVRSRAQGLILALDPLADVQGEGALQVPTGVAHFDTVVTVRGSKVGKPVESTSLGSTVISMLKRSCQASSKCWQAATALVRSLGA